MVVNRVIEGTFTLVLVFLILSRANDFYTASSAVGQTYVAAVRTLQGQ